MCNLFRKRNQYGRIVPVVLWVRESSGAVPKTPQYHSWPLLGEVIMAFSLGATQQVDLATKILDRKGNPAKVDGVPVWATDNTELLSLAPSADGLSCLVSAVGPLGSGVVSMTADADLGAGVVALVGSIDIEVTAGVATVISLTPGTPTEQP